MQKYLNDVSITDDKSYDKIMKNNNKLIWVWVWLVWFFGVWAGGWLCVFTVNAMPCSIRRFLFLSERFLKGSVSWNS